MPTIPDTRDIYFHEDDYCQQQLLPRQAAEFVEAELEKIADFDEKHRAPDGAGWTDIYLRKEAPTELRVLMINRQEFAQIVAAFLPPFDVVYSGYGEYRGLCNNTAAWGTSPERALFADWNDDGIILNVWAKFFDQTEESVLAATGALAALGTRYPLIYVDWDWKYACEAHDTTAFSSMLRSKLKAITDNLESTKNSMTPKWQPYREPLRTTLLRTGIIALIVGAVLAHFWGHSLARWPAATLLALWPSLGGHWVEIFFLNVLRPRIFPSRADHIVIRLAVWFVGGALLAFGLALTALALPGFPPAHWPTWWRIAIGGGVAFITIELVAHIPLQLRGQPSFYNGRG